MIINRKGTREALSFLRDGWIWFNKFLFLSQVLVPVYVPDSLTSSESDHVIIGISVNQNQDLKNALFRSDVASKLATLYVEGKGRKSSRRKRSSGSVSATVSNKSNIK